ncbi:MAG TPA: hypothetical protein VGY77_02610, partial [Gemmataceae bacterium]|nr:hypothetical protein [Gemmataceae bacterium]
MAKEGLWAMVCAAALLASPLIGLAFSSPPEERDCSIAETLAVQTAMQQARDYLVRNDPKSAVETLEHHLPRINGNSLYLALLRDSYRAYIKDLRLSRQEALAEKYARLLTILEPEPGQTRAQAALAKLTPPTSPAPAAPPIKSATVRGYREDEDKLIKEQPDERQKKLTDMLTKAEAAFGQNQYREANLLFEQAYHTDRQSLQQHQERWAYCKFQQVVEQINRHSTAYALLEAEVRTALNLNGNSQLQDFGKQLLIEIEKRRQQAAAAISKNEETDLPPASIQHLGRNTDGWSVTETANFRIYHTQTENVAEEAARAAERTRFLMLRKWIGGTADTWNPKCNMVLHATAQDYSRATGVPAGSPGHSSFQLEGAHVLSRRVDLHCDVPDMLSAVLPHETTHVVLAGKFGEKPVPRWADEGIAVLTEPRPKIERHLRNLPKHWQDRELYPLRQLVNMNDYPEAQRVGAFYAESVSLVDFLSQEKGPQVFTQFVRDG